MKRLGLGWVVLGMCVAAQTGADVITLYPDGMANVDSGRPQSTNPWGAGTVVFGSASANQGLLSFDLSHVGGPVQDAHLLLYQEIFPPAPIPPPLDAADCDGPGRDL